MPKSRQPTLYYILIVASVVSLIAAALLSIRVVRTSRIRPSVDVRQQDVSLIQPWMPLPYISKVYGIPMRVFDQALGLDKRNHFESIETLAKSKDMTSTALIEEIKNIVIRFHSP